MKKPPRIKKAEAFRASALGSVGGAVLSHRAQFIVQSAFAAGGFVFMDQAFIDRGIDHRHGRSEGRLRLFFVTGLDGGDNFFDERAEIAALSGIANTAFLCLTRSLFSLW